MAQDKLAQLNIDNSNPTAYPDGQIRDNDGSDNGTPVARVTMSDQFEFFAKLMRLGGIEFNNTYDNEVNGYQFINALKAFAVKNDYIYPINSVTVTPGSGSPFQAITIATNIGILQQNEFLIAIASVDFAGETKMIQQGVPAVIKNVASVEAFKANEYLILTSTISGIVITRLATAGSLSAMGLDSGFLKAANTSEAIAGTILTKAITPGTLMAAFVNWVNGADSPDFLASHLQNGLLSSAQYDLINNFSNPVKNLGWFSGFSAGSGTVGSSFAVHGDIVSAVLESTDSGIDSVVVVTLAHAMTGTNYFVRSFLESQGNILFDNNCLAPVFKPINNTSFRYSGGSYTASAQSLKIHLEVVQLT